MAGLVSTEVDSELAVAAEEEREESKHVEQEGDHQAEILSGSAPTDQRLAAGRGFGEGQAAESRSGGILGLAPGTLHGGASGGGSRVKVRTVSRG